MNVTAQMVKLALRRAGNEPIGKAAELYVICPCGSRVDMPATFEIRPGGLEVRCAACDRRIGCDGWLLDDDRDRNVPTWINQLWHAGNLRTADLQRHAAVSVQNHHRCQDCFCCAALTVLERRQENARITR